MSHSSPSGHERSRVGGRVAAWVGPGVVAALVLGLLAGATVAGRTTGERSPASARADLVGTVAAPPTAPLMLQPARRKPFRRLHAYLRQDSATSVSIRGRAPLWKNRQVHVHRRPCATGCAWRYFRATRTDRLGRFGQEIYAPRRGRLYWRVVVRETRRYARTPERAWGYTYQSR